MCVWVSVGDRERDLFIRGYFVKNKFLNSSCFNPTKGFIVWSREDWRGYFLKKLWYFNGGVKERLDVKADKGQITSSKRLISDGLMFRMSAFQLFNV